MKRHQLKQLLVQQFDEQMTAFFEQRKGYQEALAKKLAALANTYGSTVIQAAIETWTARHGAHPLDLGNTAMELPDHGSNTAKSEKPLIGKKNAKKRQKKGVESVSFSDLKPIVVKAIQCISHQSFTVYDIRNILEGMKVVFDPTHVSLILSKYIGGIQKIGIQPKKMGAPLNVYGFTGEVTLLPYTTLSKKSEEPAE